MRRRIRSIRAARARTSGACQGLSRVNSPDHADHDMLLTGASLALGAVIGLWILRRRKSTDLDALGVVSQRWIADERASPRDGLR